MVGGAGKVGGGKPVPKKGKPSLEETIEKEAKKKTGGEGGTEVGKGGDESGVDGASGGKNGRLKAAALYGKVQDDKADQMIRQAELTKTTAWMNLGCSIGSAAASGFKGAVGGMA